MLTANRYKGTSRVLVPGKGRGVLPSSHRPYTRALLAKSRRKKLMAGE
jgi:hypothetical protein